MLRRTGLIVLICLTAMLACKNVAGPKEDETALKNNAKKSAEGTFMLKIEDADLVQDSVHPESNTAEWSFNVEHVGTYEVWLSSLTCDTMNLGFDTAVTITAGDSRIQKMPVGDDIISDNNVPSPWFRANSQMGTVFFSKPGEYLVQVISEKVNSSDAEIIDNATIQQTKIKSVILKPVVY